MSYKQLGVLLLLQIFLFIQCSTAETADNKEKKKDTTKRGFMETNNTIKEPNKNSPEKNKKAITENITNKTKAGEF